MSERAERKTRSCATSVRSHLRTSRERIERTSRRFSCWHYRILEADLLHRHLLMREIVSEEWNEGGGFQPVSQTQETVRA